MKLLLAIILLVSSITLPAAPSWKKYPYQEEGSKIIFPKDEGNHKAVANLEWWYVVMHAKGKISGHDYSILVTHFNNKFRLFTVTDLTEETHQSGTARGKILSKAGYMDVLQTTEYGVDYFRSKRDVNGELVPFEYEIETNHESMHLKANLVSTRPPMMVMNGGYMKVGKSGHTFYYSNTRVKVDGVLTYKGLTEEFTASAWMDHQWGPFMISPVPIGDMFETYEWFCLQLDDGSDIMISNIYDRDFKLPQNEAYGGVEILTEDGENKHVHERIFTRNGFWKDPVSGHTMSMGWTLEVPQWNLKLQLEPNFLEQMVKMPLNGNFWEGSVKVTGTHDGRYVTGKAFGELIHRFETPKLKIRSLRTRYKKESKIKLKFKVKNLDAGNPLTYKVTLLAGEKEYLLAEARNMNEFEIDAKELLNLDSENKYRFIVEASSVDGTITSKKLSTIFKIK